MERIRSLEELEKYMKEVKTDYDYPNYVTSERFKKITRARRRPVTSYNEVYEDCPCILGEIFIHNKIIELNLCDLIGNKKDYLVIFSSCAFNHCTFSEKTIKNVVFMHCDFVKCNFTSATINDCKFKYCNFQFSKFTSAKVEDCIVEFSHVDCCNMEQIILTNSNFKCSDLYSEFLKDRPTNLNHSKIENCRIEYCDLDNASKANIEFKNTYIYPDERSTKSTNMDNSIDDRHKNMHNVPSLPEVGSFIGFMRRRVYLNNKDFYATIKVQITENSKRGYFNGKCTCTEFIPLEVYTIEFTNKGNIKRIPVDQNVSISVGVKRCKIGERVKIIDIHEDENGELKGIPFYLSEKDALGFNGLVLKEKLNGKCS